MTDEELMELAIRITKADQGYFWAPERRGERMKITRTFNILKNLRWLGYDIVRNHSSDQEEK